MAVVTKRYDSVARALLSAAADLARPGAAAGRLRPGDRLDGRTWLVTGANVGLGLAVAEQLSARGARVLMAGRTLDQGARQRVAAAGGSAELVQLDLARLDSVRAFCEGLAARGETLDGCVLNAGVVARASRRTGDGLEEMFQVNYLANVLLSRLLLEGGVLPRRTEAPRARLVLVSSEAHRSALAPDLATLGRFEPYGVRGALRHYGAGKLLLTAFGLELARREPLLAVHSLCPGAVNTRIAREAPAWSQPLIALVFRLLFRSPEQAAEPAVFLAASRAIEGQSGLYLHLMQRKEPAPWAQSEESGRELWQKSAALLRRLGF